MDSKTDPLGLKSEQNKTKQMSRIMTARTHSVIWLLLMQGLTPHMCEWKFIETTRIVGQFSSNNEF